VAHRKKANKMENYYFIPEYSKGKAIKSYCCIKPLSLSFFQYRT
jgi:hypothetical protein